MKTFDAVLVVAYAMTAMLDDSHRIESTAMDCLKDAQWDQGEQLATYMRQVRDRW